MTARTTIEGQPPFAAGRHFCSPAPVRPLTAKAEQFAFDRLLRFASSSLPPSHAVRLFCCCLPPLLLGCARSAFYQPDARPAAEVERPLPEGTDSVRNVTAGRQYAAHGGLFRVFFGAHHRRAWAAPVTAAVLDLRTAVPGGLRPTKLGGGFNSTSLSLVDTAGRPYVLRTVDKDPGRATPRLLRGTFLVNYLRDNVAATHPYAALVVPPLAAAVGVAHATPRLFYAPAGAAQLPGDSLRKLRGQLVLLEEKFSGPAKRPGLPPGTDSLLDSGELFARVFGRGAHPADAEGLLYARLLDAWLGDWDRHAGQWNWAARRPLAGPEPPAAVGYSPVAKDRDMVFYRADDGAVPWLLTRPFAIRHWTTFKARYTDPIGLMENGEYLDKRLLNGLSRAAFRRAATAMQAQLTDAAIAAALARLPAAVRAADGPTLAAALRSRRAALPAFADRFYRNLARRVGVGGTNGPDLFDVYPFADSVRITTRPAGRPGIQFQRTFHRAETRSVVLEGLGGDDVLTVHEPGPRTGRQPRLRFFGGPGRDERRGPAGGRVRFREGSRRLGRAFDKPPKD